MGYYTNYTLKTDQEEWVELELIKKLKEVSYQADYALDVDGSSYESCKWYSHEEDLNKFSKEYPDILFTLSGEGEESGDIWKAYHKNGKVQHVNAQLVFEEFNKSKLQ